jgi:hypothetical protein
MYEGAIHRGSEQEETMTRAWPILGVALLGAGCITYDVVSLQPLVTEEEAVALPQVVGTWATEEESPTVLRFEALEDKGYRMYLTEDGKERPGSFAVAFTSIGDAVYWDLAPLPVEGEDDFRAAHFLPVHSFARVTLDGDRLEVAFLDSDWMKLAFEEGGLDVAHTVTDDRQVLTASTEELRRFVADCASDTEAFGEPDVFIRQAQK